MDWEKARRRERPGKRMEAIPSRAQKPRGITNAQARTLARLQRALGEPYTGNGMTHEQAESAIAAAAARLPDAGRTPARQVSREDARAVRVPPLRRAARGTLRGKPRPAAGGEPPGAPRRRARSAG